MLVGIIISPSQKVSNSDMKFFWKQKLTVSSGTTAYLSDGETQVLPVQGNRHIKRTLKQQRKKKNPKIKTKILESLIQHLMMD
jgi:hypothetical protein